MNNGYDLIGLCVIGVATVAGAAYVAARPEKPGRSPEPPMPELLAYLKSLAEGTGYSVVEWADRALAFLRVAQGAVASGKEIWIVDQAEDEREIGELLKPKSVIALQDTVASLQDVPPRGIYRGQMGTVMELLASDRVLVEFIRLESGERMNVMMAADQLLKLRKQGAANV